MGNGVRGCGVDLFGSDRTSGRFSWKRQWNSGFHKRRKISWRCPNEVDPYLVPRWTAWLCIYSCLI